MLQAADEPINEPINEPLRRPDVPTLTGLQNRMIQELMRDHALTKEQLASLTGKSRATISRQLAKLRDGGILRRVGSKRSGHWEIMGV